VGGRCFALVKLPASQGPRLSWFLTGGNVILPPLEGQVALPAPWKIRLPRGREENLPLEEGQVLLLSPPGGSGSAPCPFLRGREGGGECDYQCTKLLLNSLLQLESKYNEHLHFGNQIRSLINRFSSLFVLSCQDFSLSFNKL
jgi:hypothetical protein